MDGVRTPATAAGRGFPIGGAGYPPTRGARSWVACDWHVSYSGGGENSFDTRYNDSAQDVLRRRYAAGEIDDEYQHRLSALR
jgi:hypothetical protein